MAAHEHGTFAALSEAEVYPGVRRRTFSSAQATVNSYAFAPGGAFPIHRHPTEQLTFIQEGSVELTVAAETTSLTAGAWSVIAPSVEHGITAGPAGALILTIAVPRRDRVDDYEVIRP